MALISKWANVGDLVFIIGKNNEIVPCKVIKIDSSYHYFEVIEDNDKKKVTRNKLKCKNNELGYNGGYAFSEKQNAIDYLTLTKNGKIDIKEVLATKTARIQSKQKTPIKSIEEIKREAASEAVDQLHKALIASMLLAMNSELKIGPKRAQLVVDKMNEYFNKLADGTITKEELYAAAKTKIKIDL